MPTLRSRVDTLAVGDRFTVDNRPSYEPLTVTKIVNKYIGNIQEERFIWAEGNKLNLTVDDEYFMKSCTLVAAAKKKPRLTLKELLVD